MEKTFLINGQEIKVQNYQQSSESVSFMLNGQTFSYSLITRQGHEIVLDDRQGRFKAAVGEPNRDGEAMVMAAGVEALVSLAQKKTRSGAGSSGGLKSPMPGKIFKVLKSAGESVKKGETILILEAMKMEHAIKSDKDGKVGKIFFAPGELVQGGVILAEVEAT